MLHKLVGTPDQRKAQKVNLLSNTDWMVTRHRDQIEAGLENPSLDTFEFGQLLDYRQALRDWPASGDYNESFPQKPSFV